MIRKLFLPSSKVNYYIFNYFIPSGLFVMVSWVSFAIPPDSVPGRIALLITTLLVLVNIANTVFSVSPAADAINALQVQQATLFYYYVHIFLPLRLTKAICFCLLFPPGLLFVFIL